MRRIGIINQSGEIIARLSARVAAIATTRYAPGMSRRRDIDWSTIFAWMVSTGSGPRATARHFALPAGTVLAAMSRERMQQGKGRLAAYIPIDTSAEPTTAGG